MLRDIDKIQLPTNTTDISVWRLFVQKIKENEPVREENCAAIFSFAKAEGKRKKKSNGDTHTKKTLVDFGLLEVVNGYVYATKLGNELLALYDERGARIADEIEETAVMLKIFKTWHATNLNRNIHPGEVILKLLVDPLMDGYISDHEIAYFAANKEFKNDSQYEEIRNYILEFRRNQGMCIALTKKSKAHNFMPTFANNWNILKKISDNAIKYDAITGIFSMDKLNLHIECGGGMK